MKKALYILPGFNLELIYSEAARSEIGKMVEVLGANVESHDIPESLDRLRQAELVFTGWNGPKMTREFLDLMPKLEMVFYGAGSIRATVTDEFWDRGLRITSAYAANAVPVSEFVLAQILFSLKRGFKQALGMKTSLGSKGRSPMPGAYGSVVGLVSLGMIGRRVAGLLSSFDVKVIAYDPFVSEETARELGIELVSLDEIFSRSDVVSLHTPHLPETEGMIRGRHFRLMKEGSTFVNTARGIIVNETEMIEALAERKDVYALLDVTYPEPPAKDSALYSMDNVVLTPHIAGSMGRECWRMGDYMRSELKRSLEGGKLEWEITRESAKYLA